MPNILVPVDFSTVSVNAALYAVQMAATMPHKEVILYHVWQPVEAGTDGTPLDYDTDATLAAALQSLEALQVSLFEMGMAPMRVVAETGELTQSVKAAIETYRIDLVVMGTTGASGLHSYYGGNALEISRDNICPVMLVPPEASFQGPNKMLLAVELKDVDTTVAITPVKKWLDLLQPELHCIYVGTGQTLNPAQEQQKHRLQEKLAGYNVLFHTVEGPNFPQAINNFAAANQISQIVIFPRKLGLFESFFATSYTRKLAQHSHIPVLIVHE